MDVLIIVLAILIGFVTGVITGLIPGLHVNTIAALMVSISTLLYGIGMDSVSIAVFIASVAVTHAFFDYIPSLFLGVPNDEVFSLLPGHRLVKRGKGLEAIDLSIKGSWNGIKYGILVLLICLLLGLLDINLLGSLDDNINPYLFWIMLTISLILIVTEKKKAWALFIFLCSGIFGILVLGSPLVPNSNSAFSGLFPALTGIFGVSGIILTLFEKVDKMPVQMENLSSPLRKGEIKISSIRGTTAGMAVGMLPGLGAANAATLLLLIEKLLGKRKENDNSEYTYIVTTSAINTSDTLFGIAALYFIEKTRSGASVAMSQLFDGQFSTIGLIAVIIAIAIAGLLSLILMKRYSLYFARFLSGMNYRALNLAILVFLFTLVYFTTGVWGLVIMIGGAFLGMMAPILNVSRAQAMGFFLVPVILFYSGYQREISTLLHTEAKVMLPKEIGISNVGIYIGTSILSALSVYLMVSYILRIKK
jgi:putative membrane protein